MSPINLVQHVGHSLFSYGAGTILSFVVGLIALYTFGTIIYNIWFHPLASYPGPKIAAATRLYHVAHTINGDWPFLAKHFHDKYGDVIRIAPDELSYANGDAFHQIQGFRPGKPELQKDPSHYTSTGSVPGSLFIAGRERHSYIRKSISHGFSERSMREQEGVIRRYIDLCVDRLRAANSEPVDLVKWLNFLTFDVMGELSFGQSFDCLESANYHPWIKLIFDNIRLGPWVKLLIYFPLFKPFSRFIFPKGLKERRMTFQELVALKAQSRKAQKDVEKYDFASGLLKSDLSDPEFIGTLRLLVVAGSETTATLMSGATYYLLKNPEKLKKVVDEVRGAFSTPEEISFLSVSKLEYLLACLNETLRVYPPVADTLPRRTGDTPELICGQVVPPHTTVGVSHWSTYHSERNFSRPDEFIPERWMGDAAFDGDKKSALQPFHVGPRNCIGKNLAYFEMRLMMALMLWNFDLELVASSENWADQKIYTLWEKPELMVKLHPRKI